MKKLLLFMGLLLLVCGGCQQQSSFSNKQLVAYGEVLTTSSELILLVRNELPEVVSNSINVNDRIVHKIKPTETSLVDRYNKSVQLDSSLVRKGNLVALYLSTKIYVDFPFETIGRCSKVFVYQDREGWYYLCNSQKDRNDVLYGYAWNVAREDFTNSSLPWWIGGIAGVLLIGFFFGGILVYRGYDAGFNIHICIWIIVIAGFVINIFNGFSGLTLNKDCQLQKVEVTQLSQPPTSVYEIFSEVTIHDFDELYLYRLGDKVFASSSEIRKNESSILSEGYNFGAVKSLKRAILMTLLALTFIMCASNYLFFRRK